MHLTVLTAPPPRCCATALAIEGFSATHRILCGGMTAVKSSIVQTSHLFIDRWIEFSQF